MIKAKNKVITFSLMLCLISIGCYAQKLTFNIEDSYVNQFGGDSDLVGLNPLFRLHKGEIQNKNLKRKIKKLPKEIKSSDLVYGFLFFKGNLTSLFENEVVFLVERVDSKSPKIYIDINGNLDFTDDGLPVNFNNESLIVKLNNSTNKKGIYHYQLGKSKISEKNSARIKQRFASKYPKSEIVSPEYWFTNQRLSVKISKHSIENKPITVLLFDADSDGVFSFNPNDNGDRIVVLDKIVSSNEDVTNYIRIGEPINHNAVFLLYGKKFSVVELNSVATKLSLIETDKKVVLKKGLGSTIPNVKISLINEETIETKKLLKEDKYLLLDFGATWCAGCIMQEPTIKEIYNTKKVNIVGVFDSNKKNMVLSYIKKHQIKWPVALITAELKKIFSLKASYPLYILISPKGKIVMMEIKSENVLKYIKTI